MRDRTMRRIRLPACLLLVSAVAACAAPEPRTTLSSDARARLLGSAAGGPTGAPVPGALEALREAAKQRPDDIAVHEQLALAAERAGLFPEAAAARRQAVAAGGRNAPSLVALGRAELRAGAGEAAVAAYAEAVSLAPGSIEAQSGLGLAADMAGDPARAQAAHRAALSLAPGDWGLLGNLALSQLMAGDAAGSVTTLARAETDVKAPRRARHNLGLALGAAGERTRLLRLLGVDMGRAAAEAEAPEFVSFGTWLAGGLQPEAQFASQQTLEGILPRPRRR